MGFWTYERYSLASWLIPVVLGLLTGLVLWLLPKKPYLFLVDRMLGISQCDSDPPSPLVKPPPDNPKSSNNIEEEGETQVEVLKKKVVLEKNRYWRFFIWLLTSLTLALSWTIIFDTIFLSSSRVIAGEQCPDYFADCFVFPSFLNFTPVGPYNCTPNQMANFPVDGSILCYS